jgi:hypothetical protein
MLAPTVVPHHHHAGMACIAIEASRHGDACDHERHGNEPDDARHATCFIESEYITPATRDGSRGKCSTGPDRDDNPFHALPVLALALDAPASPSRATRGEHLFFHEPAGSLSRHHAPRAPPSPRA